MPLALEAQGIFSETDSGTNAGVVTSHAAASGRLHIVRHISGRIDQDAVIYIRDGSTAAAAILWEIEMDLSQNGKAFSLNIPDGVYGKPGNAICGHIDSSTTYCRCNISGYSAP